MDVLGGLAYGLGVTLAPGNLLACFVGVFVGTLIGVEQDVFDTRIKGLLPTREDWKRSAAPLARGSMLGFFLGILPGIGAIIPTFISYALERRLSKHPERFGTGMIEGVAAPEAANNAAPSRGG